MCCYEFQERQYRLEAKAQAGKKTEQEDSIAKRDTLRSTLQEKMTMSRCANATRTAFLCNSQPLGLKIYLVHYTV
jgi:hypothetical protein